jgi:hypothetical protein
LESDEQLPNANLSATTLQHRQNKCRQSCPHSTNPLVVMLAVVILAISTPRGMLVTMTISVVLSSMPSSSGGRL